MAWAEKLRSGRWRGGWRTPDGGKSYTKKATHPEHPWRLKSDALAAAKEAEVKATRVAATKTGTLSAKTTWGQWWDTIATDRATGVTDTDSTDLYIVRGYLRPRWGDTKLQVITHRQVQDWVDRLATGRVDEWTGVRPPEPSYVRRIFGTFRASLQAAVAEEVLHATPCASIKLPALRKKRKQHITPDEAAVIGAKLRADYRDAIDLFLETGLRPSELCGLHAERVDLDRRRLEVDTVYVTRKKLMRSWPKDKDARGVPLTATAVDIIRRRLAGRDLTAGCGVQHADGTECRSVLVFLTERGRPMSAQQLGNRLRYAARAHEVPRRTAYAGRRGFATRAARGGMDAFAIADVMGHANVEQTQGYVQDERIGPAMRAALGDRERLKVIENDGQGEGVDTVRRGAVQSGHDGAMDHRTGS